MAKNALASLAVELTETLSALAKEGKHYETLRAYTRLLDNVLTGFTGSFLSGEACCLTGPERALLREMIDNPLLDDIPKVLKDELRRLSDA